MESSLIIAGRDYLRGMHNRFQIWHELAQCLHGSAAHLLSTNLAAIGRILQPDRHHMFAGGRETIIADTGHGDFEKRLFRYITIFATIKRALDILKARG